MTGTRHSRPRARELSGLFKDGCPEGFLLASPLKAVLEQVFSGTYGCCGDVTTGAHSDVFIGDHAYIYFEYVLKIWMEIDGIRYN